MTIDLIHGANPENLYKAFNLLMPEKISDFSTNANILSWPDIDLKNLIALASDYPDNECRRLKNIIAQRENIKPENILFTNGSNEAIFLLSRLLENKRTGILQPAYSEYKRAFRNSGDLNNIGQSGNFEAVIFSNPCNPTGEYIKNIYGLAEKFINTFFIIDEAYIDFVLTTERTPLQIHDNLIIIRSLTKIFKLAGTRIGYIIANEKIINSLKNFTPYWNVNSIAQALAEKFLLHESFYNSTRAFYKIHTPKFMDMIKNSGYKIIKSDVHYFLIEVDDDLKIIHALLKFGLVVRHTRNFKTLDGKYIRVATRTPNENKLLAKILKKEREKS